MPSDAEGVLLSLTHSLGLAHEPTAQWSLDPSRMALGDAAYARQAWWTDQVADLTRQQLGHHASIRDVTRLLSQEGPFSSAWLCAVPGKNGQDGLSDVDFRSLCRFWLGLPLLPVGRCLPPCPACGEALYPYGDHLVGCRKNLVVPRHHALRDHLCDVLQRAGLRYAKEVVIPSGGGRISPFALERPADILLLGWDRGRDVAVDLTFSHPQNLSCHPLSLEKAKRHLSDVERAKVDKEGGQCTSAGWGFHPAAFSPWGGMGPGAKSLWYEVAKKLAPDLQGWPKHRLLRDTVEGISLCIARATARQLGLRCKIANQCEDGPCSTLPPPSL